MIDMVLPRTLYTLDSQRPLSDAHSIMMEKSAQPGRGGGFTYKVVAYAPAERADTLIKKKRNFPHI